MQCTPFHLHLLFTVPPALLTSHLPSFILFTDYLRAFTWDKRLEMWIKRDILVTPGTRGLLPTIISPDYYRNRFLEAMDQYFAVIPDKWYGLADETWPG